MDGDNHRTKQHGRVMASSHMGHVAPRLSGHERFQDMHARGDQTTALSAPGSAQMSYADYVYQGNAFHGGSLQTNEIPEYHQQDFSRTQRHPHTQQPMAPQQRRRPLAQAQEAQQFMPYDSPMLYGFGHQGPVQGPYEAVPQYPARQSAAMDLSNQFGVPQYFPPEEHPGLGVVLSPYLNAHLQPAYNHPGPMARANSSQPFSAAMPDFASRSTARLEPQSAHREPQQQPQPQQQQAPPEQNLGEPYSLYQRLRGTFDHTRAGQLVEASESLLEISGWLVTHAQDLGLLRDDHHLYQDRLKLWNCFNICWLALCQKQKELTQNLVITGHQPPHTSLLSRDGMETMGKDLIQLCDQLEPHGLVDYQMGIWEEEILCILGQCLDLIESRSDLLHVQTIPEPAAAATAPRP